MARLLVVDDNADIRLLLESVLGASGHQTHTAGDGRAALAMLAAPEPGPDLVILDVQMPDIDGWHTLRAIRAEPRNAGVPVVLCTVKGSIEDIARGWECGCDGYISKPFDIDELVEVVGVVLSRTPDERRKVRLGELEALRRLMAADGRPSSRL